MLRELHVRNLAVLAGAAVDFAAGFNVLTGETGAGKSIVVDCLELLAGGRASAELIRTDADKLTVSGVFEPSGNGWKALLEEAGLDADGRELLIRREVSREGRNRVYVNDQPTTLRLLADLAPSLLRIHGQRDELGLISPELQRAWLDRSGGADAAPLLDAVADAHRAWRRLARRLESLTGDEELRRQRLDLLRFQASEIDAAELRAGEEDELRLERDQLRHREAVVAALSELVERLYEGDTAVVDELAKSAHRLQDISEWEPESASWTTELEELRIRAEEVARGVRERLDGMESDPRRLNAVEDRLSTLERLCRKYHGTTDDILVRRAEIAAELDELEGDAENVEELEVQAAAALGVYRTAALELSTARARWGRGLAERMTAELADLALEQARLEVRLERRRQEGSGLLVDGVAVDFSALGVDQVAFYFAPNPGEAAQPLSKIASGGELSRLSLALQLAARAEGTGGRPTLVFDEVDTGIGGAEGAALGAKLRRLARGGQIFAVTHLPQVASCGDHHLKVSKEVRDGRTFAEVEALSDAARVDEVARMLGGETLTELSRQHARELLRDGQVDEPVDGPVDGQVDGQVEQATGAKKSPRAKRVAAGS